MRVERGVESVCVAGALPEVEALAREAAVLVVEEREAVALAEVVLVVEEREAGAVEEVAVVQEERQLSEEVLGEEEREEL